MKLSSAHPCSIKNIMRHLMHRKAIILTPRELRLIPVTKRDTDMD
jgi:hypothetical protein